MSALCSCVVLHFIKKGYTSKMYKTNILKMREIKKYDDEVVFQDMKFNQNERKIIRLVENNKKKMLNNKDFENSLTYQLKHCSCAQATCPEGMWEWSSTLSKYWPSVEVRRTASWSGPLTLVSLSRRPNGHQN